jgi:hypothetical protein
VFAADECRVETPYAGKGASAIAAEVTMKSPNAWLTVMGFALLFARGSAQDGPSSWAQITEMRRALIGDSPLPDLPIRLEAVRKATLAEILRLLNSTTLSTADIDASYVIFHGGAAIADATPVIEAFRQDGPLYVEAGHGGENIEQTLPKLEELRSRWPTELLILAHGQHTGAMQYHEKAAIYSFDGYRLRELWATKGALKGPAFQITNDVLRIIYEDEEKVGSTLVKTIALTPGGVMEISTLPQFP